MSGKTYHPGEYRPRYKLDARAKAAAVRAARRWGAHVPSLAVAAGVSPSTIRNALKHDEAFRDDVERACAEPAQRALLALQERAIDGVNGPHGTRVYSDRLLQVWLQALDPERFGNRVKVEQETTHKFELPDVSKWPIEAVRKMKEALALVAEVERASGVPALPAPAADAVPVDAEFEEVGPADAGGDPVGREEEDDGNLPEE